MIQEPMTDFDAHLVAGSVKKAMSDVKASSRDLWQVHLGDIRILENFNVRVKDQGYHDHIRSLANSMLAEGYYQDKPLAGYVAKEGDRQVIYITDGHCRFAAASLAVQEGAEIERLPVVVSAQGTSMEDLTVALVRSNSGKPLTPFEVGVVCKRLSRFGWSPAEIAKRLDLTSTYVDGLLMLIAAPLEIREMVQNSQVSASTAIDALRAHGSGALAFLQAGLERAKASGKSRATASHMPGAKFTKSVRKVAPDLFDTLCKVKSDPGYQHISTELRETLESLVSKLEEAKASEGASDTTPQ